MEYPVTAEVVEAYATLSYQAKLAGHLIHQKIHASDRWIAATAIALDVSLLTADRMFLGGPRLQVVNWWPDLETVDLETHVSYSRQD